MTTIQFKNGIAYGLETEEPGQARSYYRNGFNVNDDGRGGIEILDFDTGETVEEYHVDKEGRLDGMYTRFSQHGDVLEKARYVHGKNNNDEKNLKGPATEQPKNIELSLEDRFLDALRTGNYKELENTLEEGVNPNTCTAYGEPPFHLLTCTTMSGIKNPWLKRSICAKKLLEYGADITKTFQGMSAVDICDWGEVPDRGDGVFFYRKYFQFLITHGCPIYNRWHVENDEFKHNEIDSDDIDHWLKIGKEYRDAENKKRGRSKLQEILKTATKGKPSSRKRKLPPVNGGNEGM